ncbi:cobalamin biosynthesis protein [Actinomadura graeca]|uniref:Cobalamin biosynthesis protein n=1 Tax=Actinomadura graeca TaxID=2750812 RepID=A0ABX8QS62_9ACTN|nr:cobalamin biosynthesis protein [Actinomadura graeca]QXJ21049.1 cobalamin biosynthesis protein [Actinomadura graeca]
MSGAQDDESAAESSQAAVTSRSAESSQAVQTSETAVVGVGASSGASAREVGGLIDLVLAEAGLAPRQVRCVATADGRAAEPLLRAAAGSRGLPLVTYPVAVLARVGVPHPSDAVRARTGTASVAEAAALHAALPAGRAPGGGQARLVVRKRRSAHATAAVATAAREAPDEDPAHQVRQILSNRLMSDKP